MILFDHSHGRGYTNGKQEFIERRSYLQPKPCAQELSELGYVALCIDQWVFGERSHTSAHLGLAELRDKLTPVEGLDIIDNELKQVYAKAGHPER